MASHGVTSAQDFSQWEDFEIYEELEADGKLTARISEWLPFDESLEDLTSKRKSHPQSDNMPPYRNVERLHGWFPGIKDRRCAGTLCR